MAGQYSDSEFDSDIDEAEMKLYQQLYFDDKYCEIGKSRPIVSLDQLIADQKNLSEDFKINKIEKNLQESVDFTVPCNGHVVSNLEGQNLSQHVENEMVKNLNEEYEEGQKMTIKDNQNPLTDKTSRIRTVSACSVESISGKIPLDFLYLNENCDDDICFNEIDEGSMECEKEKTGKSKKVDCKNDSKSKKCIRTIVDDDDDDSKCSALLGLKKKNSPLPTIIDDSDLDEVTVVSPVPPEPKHITVVDDDIDGYSSDSISILEYKNLNDRPIKKRKSVCTNNTKRCMQKVSSCTTSLKSKKQKAPLTENMDPTMTATKIIKPINRVTRSNKESVLMGILNSSSNENSLDSGTSSDEYSLDIGAEHMAKSSELVFNTSIQLEDERLGKSDLKLSRVEKMKHSQVIFSKGRPLTKRTPSCKKWTQEMASLYDSDESGEFSLREIHAGQSDSASLWKIDYEDLCPKRRPRYFNRVMRCNRCRQEGHLVKDCKKKSHCLYCGSTDHVYRSCPMQCCLRCGGVHGRFCEKTHARVTCLRCLLKGHDVSLCPDTWRRFHRTTSGSTPIQSNVVDKRPIKYCYNCAKKGHFGSDCRARSFYIPVPRSIYSYEDLDFHSSDKCKKVELKSMASSIDNSSISMILTRRNFLMLKDSDVIKSIENMSSVKIEVYTSMNICKVHIGGLFKNCREAQNLLKFYCENRALPVTPRKSMKRIDRNDNIIDLETNSRKIDWNRDFLSFDKNHDGMLIDFNNKDVQSPKRSCFNDISNTSSVLNDSGLESLYSPTDEVPHNFETGLRGRFNRFVEAEFSKFPKTGEKIRRYINKRLKCHPTNRFINIFKKSYKELKDCIEGVYQNDTVKNSVPSNKLFIDKYFIVGSLLSVHLLNKYHHKMYYNKLRKLVSDKGKTKNCISMDKKRMVGNYFFNIYIPELSELKNVLSYGQWVLENREKVKSYFNSRKSDGSYDSKVIKNMKFFNPVNKDYFNKLKKLKLKSKKEKKEKRRKLKNCQKMKNKELRMAGRLSST